MSEQPKHRLPKFPGLHEQVRKQASQEQVPKQASQQEVPRNRFPSKVPKEQVPKQGFPRGSQEVPKNSFSSKVHKEQVPKQGSDEQVPGNVSKNRCPRKVPSIGNNRLLQSFEELFK